MPHINVLDPPPNPLDSPDLYPAQISLHSLVGHLASETLCLVGTLTRHHVVLLVDGESTHNFIQQQLVTQLGLPFRENTPLRVMVGNGQHLVCNCICEAITVDIQATKFTIDLYVLPISGANVVLGVQWLKSLDPVLTDYNTQCMQFFHEGCLVELKGDNDANLGLLTSPQFHRLCRKQGNGLYFHIAVLSEEATSSDTKDHSPEIQALLTKFDSLFKNPHVLSPAWDTNHHVHLIPQSAPVNLCSYRYPHYKKQEIELQVESLLQKGLI